MLDVEIAYNCSNASFFFLSPNSNDVMGFIKYFPLTHDHHHHDHHDDEPMTECEFVVERSRILWKKRFDSGAFERSVFHNKN